MKIKEVPKKVLNDYIEKYEIERKTVTQLLNLATKQIEIDKYSSVRRFISSFIYDLNNIKSILDEQPTVNDLIELRRKYPNDWDFAQNFDKLVNQTK